MSLKYLLNVLIYVLHANEVPVALLHTISVSVSHFESGTKDFTDLVGWNGSVHS